jgi:chaperonin GroEL
MAKFLKQLKFNTEAREKLLEGMEVVASAVGSTLGPRGRNVAVDQMRDYDVPPVVLHDWLGQ